MLDQFFFLYLFFMEFDQFFTRDTIRYELILNFYSIAILLLRI